MQQWPSALQCSDRVLVSPDISTFKVGSNFADNPSSIMGNSRSAQLETDDIEEISEETGFTRPQIERLYDRFKSLDKTNQGYLTREDFIRIPELAINPLGDRIVHAFFYESKNNGEEKVDFKVKENLLTTFTILARILCAWWLTSDQLRKTRLKISSTRGRTNCISLSECM